MLICLTHCSPPPFYRFFSPVIEKHMFRGKPSESRFGWLLDSVWGWSRKKWVEDGMVSGSVQCVLDFGQPNIPSKVPATSQRKSRDYITPNPLPSICQWETLTKFGRLKSRSHDSLGVAVVAVRSEVKSPEASYRFWRITCFSASGQRLQYWLLWLSVVAALSFTSQLFQWLYNLLIPIPGIYRVASGFLSAAWFIQYVFQKNITLHETATF